MRACVRASGTRSRAHMISISNNAMWVKSYTRHMDKLAGRTGSQRENYTWRARSIAPMYFICFNGGNYVSKWICSLIASARLVLSVIGSRPVGGESIPFGWRMIETRFMLIRVQVSNTFVFVLYISRGIKNHKELKRQTRTQVGRQSAFINSARMCKYR